MKPQQLQSDCAAACLVYIAEHYGRRVAPALVRRLAGTSRTSTTCAGLVEAANRLGFSAKAVKGSFGDGKSCPTPVIAHVVLPGGLNHYVVVTELKRGRVRVADPAVGGKQWHSIEEFARISSGVFVLLAPGAGFAHRDRREPTAVRMLRLLSAQRSLLAQVVAGALALSAIGLVMSFYAQHVMDDVIPDHNGSLLNLLGCAMLALFVARGSINWFQFILSTKLAQRMDSSLILEYYRHVLRLPQAFFDSMRVGEINSRVLDAVQIRSFLSSVLIGLVLNPIILVTCFAAMFLYSAKLALLSLAVLPLQITALFWANRINRKYQRAIKERVADMSSHVTEALQTAATIKRFGGEAAVAARSEACLVRLLRTTWNAGIETYYCSAFSGLGGSFYSLGLLWFGASLTLRESLTPGELISAYTLAMYVSGALGNLMGISASYQATVIAADRLFEILDEEPEPEGGRVRLDAGVTGPIVLDKVTLRHPGRKPALRDVSVTIPAGCATIVSGGSGSGKSSLFGVLQRLYPPESGHVAIGNIDYGFISTASLRAQLSVLPQRIDLISGSLLENIAVADPEPDIGRVVEVCAALGLGEFVNALPQKLATSLNEGGLTLSGGQRQRIALARVFYRRSPIILLDEPATALDRQSIQLLVGLIQKRKAEGCTFVIATHTRALVSTADYVLTLSDGRVVSFEPAAKGRTPAAAGPGGAVAFAAAQAGSIPDRSEFFAAPKN